MSCVQTVLLVTMGLFIGVFGHRKLHTTEFLISGCVFGAFCWSHLMPYFAPVSEAFGVFGGFVIVVGAVIGGIFGMLLPRITTGIIIGVCVSLFALAVEIGHLTITASQQLIASSAAFVTLIACGILLTLKFEKASRIMSIGMVSGLLLVTGIDINLKSGLVAVFEDIFHMSTTAEVCYGACYVPGLLAGWFFLSIFFALVQVYLQWSSKGPRGYSNLKQADPTRITKQRTFEYSDNQEFNFFDPEGLPPPMAPFADMVYKSGDEVGTEFGFQVDNIRNQMEHLCMLLANEVDGDVREIVNRHMAVYKLHQHLFLNYQTWCHRLGVKPCFSGKKSVGKESLLSEAQSKSQITDLLLFLLIWGEAANLRHMPESLCFLYHKLMQDHVGKVGNPVNYPGFFLDHIITPIFDIISSQYKGALAKQDHQYKKNYDDLNEFFWSPVCLKYHYLAIDPDTSGGARVNGDVQHDHDAEVTPVYKAMAANPKTYLEKRSWLHLLLSFHRIIEWHIISFALLTAVAYNDYLLWDIDDFLKIASGTLWLANFLNIVWVWLELWTLFPDASLSGTAVCSILIRLLTRYLLLVYQSIYYMWAFTTEHPPQGSMQAMGDKNFWWWQFVWVSVIALGVWAVDGLAQFTPKLISYFYTRDNQLLQAFLNICFPFTNLFVGKDVDVPWKWSCTYIFFWLTMIAWKLLFSYLYEVRPMVEPTLQLSDIYLNYPDTSLAATIILILLRWAPQFLVYCLDLAIWYSVWSSITGAVLGLFDRHGAVRDLKTLRSHFVATPDAFHSNMVPPSVYAAYPSADALGNIVRQNSKTLLVSVNDAPPNTSKQVRITAHKLGPSGSKNHPSLYQFVGHDEPDFAPDMESPFDPSTLRNYVGKFLDVRTKRWVVFAKVWNEIIFHLRETDLISNGERGVLQFDKFDWLSKPVYLPVFQTAGCCEKAMHISVRSASLYRQEPETSKRIQIVDKWRAQITDDITVAEAVSEAWELFSWVLEQILGDHHRGDIKRICEVIGTWAHSDALFAKMALDDLPGFRNSVVAIVKVLRSHLPKRKPVVMHELSSSNVVPTVAPASVAVSTGMRKSVSTSFLAKLSEAEEDETSETTTPKSKVYQKLQPFRKMDGLPDKTRDAVRDQLRPLLNGMRSALRGASGSEGSELVDRITFIMSLEDGFFWKDEYASSQMDDLAADKRIKSVLQKLDGLLSLQQTQAEPTSIEGRRRLTFFVNSLFMEMPQAPSVRKMRSLTVVTPFYAEDVLLSQSDLESNDANSSQQISTILYLQTLYKHDWLNFLERVGLKDDTKIWTPKYATETRMWASLRAQTLFRTVEGMMYGDSALDLLTELEGINKTEATQLIPQKFGYVVATQVYGRMKKNQEQKAEDIEFLLKRHPNLRVAYIDEVRTRTGDISYYSVLMKGSARGVKEVYRIGLPGNPVVGEGKPENQNHAIIFTRGQHVMAIDMNQDGYFEEALKIRNMLQEFRPSSNGTSSNPERIPAIIGFREHIFTGAVSSLANYMALQETSFVTLGQRVLDRPLRIRQHYGHPDMFDKVFVMTKGGMSKASKGINLSEDVFAGYNCTIRGDIVKFKEYMQVGKGRDVGMQQIYKFEAKLSQGASEQSLSRDVHRVCERLDFFRLMSFFYGGIGHYVTNVLVIAALNAVTYSLLLLALYKREKIGDVTIQPEGTLQLILGGMGLLQTLPLFFTLAVEKGIGFALLDIGQLVISGGPLYFIFQIQTKSYYFAQTILAGGAQYRATGRGFVTRHSQFAENFRFFAASHLYVGLELATALVLFGVFTETEQYAGKTWALWMSSVSFLLAPFWFNPLAFEWSKVSSDYTEWLRWMGEQGGSSENSWEVWWKEEHDFISKLSMSWRITLAGIRCGLYLLIGIGLVGERALEFRAHDWEKTADIFGLFGGLLLFYWVVEKLERRVSYALRRAIKLLVGIAVIATLVFLFCKHTSYIQKALGCYFICGALAYFGLLCGFSSVSIAHWIHDFVLGHIIFVVLFSLAALQVPAHVQTWLLYHDALSQGVVIDDILKHARESQQAALAVSSDQSGEVKRLTQLLVEKGIDPSTPTASGSVSAPVSVPTSHRPPVPSGTGAGPYEETKHSVPSVVPNVPNPRAMIRQHLAQTNGSTRAYGSMDQAGSSSVPVRHSVSVANFNFAPAPDRPPPRA